MGIGRKRFTEIVEESYRSIYRLAFSMLGSEQDACDVTQESFERLWRYRSKVDERAAYVWLRRTALNLCVDLLRRRKTEPEPLDPNDEGSSLIEMRPDPLRRCLQKEEMLMLRRALDRLPEKYRAAVILRDVEDLSYREISQILGRPENTVKSDVLRGRRMLRKILAPYFDV